MDSYRYLCRKEGLGGIGYPVRTGNFWFLQRKHVTYCGSLDLFPGLWSSLKKPEVTSSVGNPPKSYEVRSFVRSALLLMFSLKKPDHSPGNRSKEPQTYCGSLDLFTGLWSHHSAPSVCLGFGQASFRPRPMKRVRYHRIAFWKQISP